MKNFKIIVSFLLLNFTLFQGCQKESISVPESISETKGTIEPIAALMAACNPTFPAITTSSPLFEFRYNIALYRFYAKIYLDFKGRVPNGNPFAVTIADTDLARLGLKELIINKGVQSDLVNTAREHYKGTTVDAWTSVTNFISLQSYQQKLSVAQKLSIVTKSNTWGDTAPTGPTIEGSYTIFFNNVPGYTYNGKGGGLTQGVYTRCLASANERCAIIPTIADAQQAASLPNYTLSDQAFKEEAIRMFTGKFTKAGPGNTLNVNQSPGVNYILRDGI